MLFAPAQAKQQPCVVLHGRDVGHAPVPELGAKVAHASHGGGDGGGSGGVGGEGGEGGGALTVIFW